MQQTFDDKCRSIIALYEAMPKGPEDTFDHVCREIVELSDLIDNYDLVSADRESSALFRRLQAVYVQRSLDLIEMIEDDAAHIRERLQSLLRVT